MSSTNRKPSVVPPNILTVISMMKKFGIYRCDGLILKILSEYTQKCLLFILTEAISHVILTKRNIIEMDDLQLAIQKAKDSSFPLERVIPNPKERITSIPRIITHSIPNPRTNSFDKAIGVLIPKEKGFFTSKERTGSISKARASTIPRFSPYNNAEQHINMFETPDYELTYDVLCDIVETQFNQKLDDVLPDLSGLDIEEAIRSLQNIQDNQGNQSEQDKQDNQNVTTYKFNVDALLNDPNTL